MPRPLAGWLACTLVAVGVLLGPVRPLRAAQSPLAGNWKVVVFDEEGVEVTLCLVGVTAKNGKVKASILSSAIPMFKKARLEKFSAGDKSVQLTFKTGSQTLVMTAGLPDEEKPPKKLLATL